MVRSVWAVFQAKEKTCALVHVTETRPKSFNGVHLYLVCGALVAEWSVVKAQGVSRQERGVIHPNCRLPLFGSGYYVTCEAELPKAPKDVPRL